MLARTVPGFDCIICGGRSGRIRRRAGEWRLVECGGCGVLATWPRPDERELAAFYESHGYFEARGMTAESFDAAAARAAEVLARLGSEGPVLDFGAGTGRFVAGVRALGVEADGVEPSATARAVSEASGVTLLAGLPPRAEGRYAIVTMFHVLEHVRDPVGELRRLRDLLSPGGRILIEVPHAGSVRWLPPARRKEVLDLPVHLHHFTPATLRRPLALAGLDVVGVRRFNPWFVEALLSRRPATPASAAARGVSPSGEGRTRATPLRAAWRHALPGLRRAFPGEKFELVARASP